MASMTMVVAVAIAVIAATGCSGRKEEAPEALGELAKPAVGKPRAPTQAEDGAIQAKLKTIRAAYNTWALKNPTRACPASLSELKAYMDDKDTTDPWGKAYGTLCDPSQPISARVVRVVSGGADGVPGTGDEVTATIKAPEPEVVVDITARQLLADYEANEISADAKYRSKALRVSGKVAKIGKDVLDDPYVELAGPNEYTGVNAHFESEGSLGSLRKGQRVTVRCVGKGTSLGSPFLGSCVLDLTNADVAHADAMKLASDGYDSWAAKHPTQKCPRDLFELTNGEWKADPWGQLYRGFCNSSAPLRKRQRVSSNGPDLKPDTADDIKSWE